MDDERTEARDDGTAGGISMSAVLGLPDDQRRLVNWLMRAGRASVAEIAAHFEVDEPTARDLAETLAAAGFLRRGADDGVERYRAQVNARPNRRVSSDLWKALE
jgi:DNA-binding Lrp family transcriptional regulator